MGCLRAANESARLAVVVMLAAGTPERLLLASHAPDGHSCKHWEGSLVFFCVAALRLCVSCITLSLSLCTRLSSRG